LEWIEDSPPEFLNQGKAMMALVTALLTLALVRAALGAVCAAITAVCAAWLSFARLWLRSAQPGFPSRGSGDGLRTLVFVRAGLGTVCATMMPEGFLTNGERRRKIYELESAKLN
jgi:hypothetical protein